MFTNKFVKCSANIKAEKALYEYFFCSNFFFENSKLSVFKIYLQINENLKSRFFSYLNEELSNFYVDES